MANVAAGAGCCYLSTGISSGFGAQFLPPAFTQTVNKNYVSTSLLITKENQNYWSTSELPLLLGNLNMILLRHTVLIMPWYSPPQPWWPCLTFKGHPCFVSPVYLPLYLFWSLTLTETAYSPIIFTVKNIISFQKYNSFCFISNIPSQITIIIMFF